MVGGFDQKHNLRDTWALQTEVGDLLTSHSLPENDVEVES